jgi:16S rRNA (cytosine1402-N4)-methyltransferase
MEFRHTPVMRAEVLAYLNCRPGKVYADCTLGGSGHARAILEKILPNGLLIGIDQDRDAVENAARVLAPYEANIRLFHDSFTHLPEILSCLSIVSIDGVLADLGLSSHQLEASGRGFSFRKNEPLDMRMNIDATLTAEDIINSETEARLEGIFRNYGEERWAGRIARKIVAARAKKRIQTSEALARLVLEAVPRKDARSRKIHPATKIFMSLRIAVNRELENLDAFIPVAVDALAHGGRLCILSFHSLEDRIVKHRLKELAQGCICPSDFPQCVCGRKKKLRVLTRKAVRPAAREIAQNPLARSSRLRAGERLKEENEPGAHHERGETRETAV